jgi:hypothetical protein
MIQVGYSQAVITPALEPPVFMAGFEQNRIALSVHDDLYARFLALQTDSDRILVLGSLDLIGLFRPDVEEVIARINGLDRFQGGIPAPDIILSCAHPHHGPDTMGLWGPDMKTSGVNPPYLAWLKKCLVDTIMVAIDNLRPAAGMRYASVGVPGLAKNARDAEIVDDELIVAQFLDLDQQAIVTLFNYACHPEVLWIGNPHITADYVGYLRQAVEAQTAAPCIFFSADLGGMMTPDVHDHSFAEAESMGTALAAAGLEAISLAGVEETIDIGRQRELIREKMTNPLFKLAIRRGLFPDIRGDDGRIQTEMNLIQIGHCWFVTVPGELLPKLGLQMKRELRRAGAAAAGVIGLANDELGYILPRENFRFPLNPFHPGKHYEETNSISKGIGPAVLAGLKRLIASNTALH